MNSHSLDGANASRLRNVRPANDLAGGAQNARETEQGLFIHLVSTEQVGVIAEIPQEPIQFPQGLLGAIEPPRNFARGKFLRLQDGETENEEGLLRVPAIIGSVHAHQEDAFQEFVRVCCLACKPGKCRFMTSPPPAGHSYSTCKSVPHDLSRLPRPRWKRRPRRDHGRRRGVLVSHRNQLHSVLLGWDRVRTFESGGRACPAVWAGRWQSRCRSA